MDHHLANNVAPLSFAVALIEIFIGANKNVVAKVTCIKQRGESYKKN
jgi:hypothetical protein